MEGQVTRFGGGGRLSRWLQSSVVTVLLAVLVVLNLLIFAGRLSNSNLPGNFQGFDPAQPIAFSHRLHSGEMQIPCLYCHPAAAKERYAGFPSARTCLNCHRFVQARLGAVREEERLAREENREVRPVASTEIEKIYRALGLDFQQQSVRSPERIRWIRVSHLPDFAVFQHGAHSAAGSDCSECHGTVEKMERVRQAETFSMGWCLDCHRLYTGRVVADRTLKPSMDCGVCHY